MHALLPLLLLGGAVGVALNHPASPQPLTPPAPPPATSPLGGYLQGVQADLATDPTRAKNGYLAALTEDPDNTMLRNRTLAAALAVGDFDTATRLAKTLPTLQQPAMAQLALLVSAVKVNDLPAARAQLRSLKKLSPTMPALLVLDAYLAAAEGTPVAKLVAPMQAANPGWGGYWHAARLHFQAGDTAAAQALLAKALALNPGALPAAQMALGLAAPAQVAAIQQNFMAANPTLAPVVQEPLTFTPPVAPLKANIAAALLEFALQVWAEGVPPLALQLINLAENLGPVDAGLSPMLPYYRALLQEASGASAEALTTYNSLQKTGPASLQPLLQLRLNELALQQATTPKAKRQAAAAAWQLALQNPSYSVFWHSAGQLALVAEDYTRAAEASSRLLPLLPSTPLATLPLRQAELYFARGAAHAQSGNAKAAEADLQQAIKLNPAHAEALNYLGFLWVDANRNLAQAYALLKQAHLLAPNNGAITDSVGWAYHRQGDYATALIYLEKAAAQEPNMPEILSHLADTYARLGNMAEARKLWRRALDLAEAGAQVPSAGFTKTLRQKATQGKLIE